MPTNQTVKLIECPRDAMQGWQQFIPTEKKIEYIQSLLRVGFDTLDAGSFVSPKAIPQLADTAQVMRKLDMGNSKTKLLVIVANTRGAEEAVAYDTIAYLGFPLSVSPSFQQRNTNSSIKESLQRVAAIQEICSKHGKQLVVYISMGFGNPYGDLYSADIVYEVVAQVAAMGVQIISLADTVGLASAEQVFTITQAVFQQFPAREIGVHLHAAPGNWETKLKAAIRAGCTRFDGALKGIGGCPMAGDDLVGNMDMERMVSYFEQKAFAVNLDKNALAASSAMASTIFV